MDDDDLNNHDNQIAMSRRQEYQVKTGETHNSLKDFVEMDDLDIDMFDKMAHIKNPAAAQYIYEEPEEEKLPKLKKVEKAKEVKEIKKMIKLIVNK